MDYVSYAAAILLSILVVVTSSTNIGYMEEYSKQNARKRLDIVINNAADSSLQDALQRLVVDSKEVKRKSLEIKTKKYDLIFVGRLVEKNK